MANSSSKETQIGKCAILVATCDLSLSKVHGKSLAASQGFIEEVKAYRVTEVMVAKEIARRN